MLFWLAFLSGLLLWVWIPPGAGTVTQLERIQQRGELHILTRNSATTYYLGPEGPTGFSYDLASRFAASLGVKPVFEVADNFHEILPRISRAEVPMAAAGITITKARKPLVQFSPPVLQVTQQVVYRAGERRPRKVDDLAHGVLEVVAGSSHEERLEELSAAHPELSWEANPDWDLPELLNLVARGLIDYTVADSNELAVYQGLYPELRVGFELSPPQPLAWAFPHDRDDSLFLAASAFLLTQRKNGELERIQDRWFGHVERFDYVDTRAFRRAVLGRLPELRLLFEQAARETGLDWRLLAAVSYQESHWKSDAVSPTGVRGLMMLTQAAARRVGVKDRRDPQQSILGGARYLTRMRNKIPARIPEPDRMWLTLAAYNVGFGHLEDARKLAQRRGGDPDRWLDVEKALPLLSQKKWHTKTRHGFARGQEPVRYVENVRRYYDLLTRMLLERRKEQQAGPAQEARATPSAKVPTL